MNEVTIAQLVPLQATVTDAAGHEALDPLQLVLEASTVVQLVMLVLLLMSLGCWFVMGAKFVRLAQAKSASRRFLELFWGGDGGPTWSPERLEGVYSQVKTYEASPIASVFRAGYVELARMLGANHDAAREDEAFTDIGNVERALRRTSNNELTDLEAFLPFLATTASTAPFIGLFGTVWGIMNSFIAIGGNKNASLDVVAPGIAEALIATAIGLAAAIPAVMAYNYFVRRIRVLESEMDAFSSDYLNIVRRHFLRT